MKAFRITRPANAFFPSGQLRVKAPPLLAIPGIKLTEKSFGGLWVGGTVEISHNGVEFRANAMNRALHIGVTSVTIASQAIRSMRREFGFITGIVAIDHDAGEFRFRCYGAKGVVAKYQAAKSSDA